MPICCAYISGYNWVLFVYIERNNSERQMGAVCWSITNHFFIFLLPICCKSIIAYVHGYILCIGWVYWVLKQWEADGRSLLTYFTCGYSTMTLVCPASPSISYLLTWVNTMSFIINSQVVCIAGIKYIYNSTCRVLQT